MQTRRKQNRAAAAALVAVLAAALVALSGTIRAEAGPVPLSIDPPAEPGCYDSYVDCGAGVLETDTVTESPNAYEYAAGNCRTRWARATRKNLFMLVVFQYKEQVRWCWSGNRITYFWRDRWPSNTHYGWSFDGNIGTNCSLEHCKGRGVGTYSTDAWTQGSFHACVLGKFCVYKYPLVDIWVHGDGGSGATESGA
jgi:hypothetical protein